MSVYFITCREIGMVKIGCARNPFVRLATLQTAFPLELKIEAHLKGSYALEKEMHERFAKERVRGEWFRITPEIDLLLHTVDAPERPRSEAQKTRLYRMHDEPKPRRDPDERFEVREIKRREARGDIHFPFRQPEQVE